MTDLCKCLGRSTYEELSEHMISRKGSHDEVWNNDDKISIYYYTGDNYSYVNEALRNSPTEIFQKEGSKTKNVADFISDALSKAVVYNCEKVYRWENDFHMDINSIKKGSIIKYSAFVSTSIDPDFNFYNSKPRKLTISTPCGVYIAEYSQSFEEKELLIDKGCSFIVDEVDSELNTISLRQLNARDIVDIGSKYLKGEVA